MRAIPRLFSVSASAGKAAATAQPALVVFDSRIPASRAFAQKYSSARVDVALEDVGFWRTLRAELPKGAVFGMTGWSDWVMVRGLLEEKGLRLVSEVAAPAPRSGKAHLFAWEMR